MKIMSVFGTRPEAIKMCPLIKEMQMHSEIKSVVCLTGQHKEMLQQVIDIFSIQVDYNLHIMKPLQTLTTITTDILILMKPILEKERPDIVLVHGDTTTSFAVALAAFYEKIPVGHVEAGLRTYDKYAPFPEEMNRTLTSRIADIHFAPTRANQLCLEKENIYNNIFVTGNTVIDALNTTVREDYQFKSEQLKSISFVGKRMILVTAHRRENLGKPLEQICEAIKEIVDSYSDIEVVYPVHLNPKVRETVTKMLEKNPKIHLIDPIDVEDMHNLMARSYLVMTDSGGIQEEAPSCGIPVVVLRNETERREAIEAGTVLLAGTKREDIVREVKLLIEDGVKYQEMARAVNPYGDGHASERIVEALFLYFGGKE
ncbi:UDP-N-acetylglucosamine 2-epimerase (non-hydrolyzing) [Lachnospiraceae bacterium OM04-12BH]|nr:UDP-N-acetylglucosamine 2-epimerase (non-hydrolyzing) [Lachnospiraceae bacterium OM04-12BH]